MKKLQNILTAGVFALLATGCISHAPLTQYSNNLNVASLYAYDDSAKLVTHPLDDNIRNNFNQALTNRNLNPSEVQYESFAEKFGNIRDTDRRLQLFKNIATNSDILVLVELNANYYSVLSGRYRWNVNVNVTIYDANDNTKLSNEFTIPAALLHQHQTGEDAIDSVKDEINRKIGGLVDQFMKGRPEKSANINNLQTTTLAQQNSNNTDAIYFVLVDRFFDLAADYAPVDKNDPKAWHGGDLKGITAKLKYLQKLGIRTLWLSPIFQTGQENFFQNGAFHGYWTYDLNKLEPRFGNIEDFETLTKEAKKYNIKILLDLVVNHVGYGAPIIEQKPHWFHPPYTIENWDDVQQLTQRQVHGLPDLDQEQPEVYKYLKNAALYWLQFENVAGFRLDAVKHVPIDFWKKFNQELKENSKNITLLGEYFDGSQEKMNNVQKEGNFTHIFDFPLAFALRDVFCENKSLANIATVISNDHLYTNPNSLVTFLDNHDMPRFITHCHDDLNKMKDALTLMLSLRGTPSIYYGTETPLQGAEEPYNRNDMQFDNLALYSHIQEQLAQRTQYQALSSGKSTILDYQPNFLAIAQETPTQQAILYINHNNTHQKTQLPDGKWIKLDSHTPIIEGNITLPPNSITKFVQNNYQTSLLKNNALTYNFTVENSNHEKYAIAGSCPELGFWNPNNAPILDKQNNYTLNIKLPENTVITYKLVKINENNSTEWEIGENRELFTTSTQNSKIKLHMRQ